MAEPTSVYYPGDGTTTDRNFPFPYLSPTHVKVTVDGAAVSFSFIAQNTVRISPAPAAGKTIRIYRDTAKSPIITWEDGVVILGRDMNAANVQNIYIAEEAFNQATSLAEEAKQFALDSISGAVEDALLQSEARLALVVTDPAAQAVAAAAQAANDLVSVSNVFDQVHAEKDQVNDAVAQANESLAKFRRTYLGEMEEEPTLDDEGQPLIIGALFYDTTINKLKVYTPSGWKLAYNAVEGLPEIAASNVDNDSNVTGTTVRSALNTLKTALDGLGTTLSGLSTAVAGKQDTIGYAPVDRAGDTITGSLVVDGTLTTTTSLFKKIDADINGGRITLEKADNDGLAGNIRADLSSGSIRFYEAGGNYRGVKIDITAAANNAGSQLWHSDNDGSGSGLDADTLDGAHASSFWGPSVNTYSPSRSGATTYQNTTGRPMYVQASLLPKYTTTDAQIGTCTCTLEISSNGTTWTEIDTSSVSRNSSGSTTLIPLTCALILAPGWRIRSTKTQTRGSTTLTVTYWRETY